MHTRDEPGINLEVVKDLQDNFTWVPPLSVLSDLDGDLASPETVSLDKIDAEFAALEEQKKAEQLRDPDGQEVLGGLVYNFEELRRVDEGIVPRAVDDEITVVEHNADGEKGWDIAVLMSSSSLKCP